MNFKLGVIKRDVPEIKFVTRLYGTSGEELFVAEVFNKDAADGRVCMDIKVREMTDSDILSVHEIYRSTWSPSNSPVDKPMSLNEFQQRDLQAVLVACSEEDIAGYIHLIPRSDPLTSAHVVNFSVYVSPEFQGNGIGTKLLKSAEDWCIDHGKHKLALGVLSTNPRAISLYKRCGFKEEGRLRGEYLFRSQYVDDVLMAKWL